MCERMDFWVRGRKREGGRGQGKSVQNVFAENPEENIKWDFFNKKTFLQQKERNLCFDASMTKLKLFKQKINCSSLQPFFLNEQNKTISIPDQGLKNSTVSFFCFLDRNFESVSKFGSTSSIQRGGNRRIL